MNNDGLLTIAATASATGQATQAAYATNKSGVFQGANADDGGNASNSITNADDGRDRHSRGCQRRCAEYGSAYASAAVQDGIDQNALAFGGGNASNALDQ